MITTALTIVAASSALGAAQGGGAGLGGGIGGGAGIGAGAGGPPGHAGANIGIGAGGHAGANIGAPGATDAARARVDRATDRANPSAQAEETVRGATDNAVQSIGGARNTNSSAGASASASAAAATDLQVGETIVNASGETVGTIDKVITARDGSVERVFIRMPNSNRRGTTTRILPARAVNIREGNVITSLSAGELNRMPAAQ